MTARAVPSSRAIVALAASCGAVAAGQAIVWSRVLASANGNRAETWAHAIGAVLVGYAIGIRALRGVAERRAMHTLRVAAVLMAAAGTTFFLALPLGAAAMLRAAQLGREVLLLGAAVTAAAASGALPVLARTMAPGTPAPGAESLWLGAAFVAGAACGAPLTAYVLLGNESLPHVVLLLTLAALGVAQAMRLAAPGPRGRAGQTILPLMALAALAMIDPLYQGFLERVHFGPGARAMAYGAVAPGRAGSVGVTADGRAFEEGALLGPYALDATAASDFIRQAYLVPTLHRAPRRVLQLGFGTGAWTRLIADIRGVESLTVIEPNTAVVDAVWRHPEIAGVLDDARVRLHFDDPRRWLREHLEVRFDVIVANGPRRRSSGARPQLSAEYLRLMKSRLADGGIVYVSSNGSLDAAYTAAGVFRHVVRVAGHIAAGDAPFDQSPTERRDALLTVIGPGGIPRLREALASATPDQLLGTVSGDLAPALRRANDLWNVTDDNLASEFKATGAGAWWRALPSRVWRPDRAWPTVLF